jgi:hypothetical protein
MKQDKSKVDLYDDLMTYALEQEINQTIKNMPSEECLQAAYQPSPEFEGKMQRLFNQETKIQRISRRRQITKIMQRIAACIVIAIAISAVTITNVEAFRIRFYNIVMEVKEKYLSITFEGSEQKSSDKEFELQVYMPTYLPQGFYLQETSYFDNNSVLNYQDDSSALISIKQSYIHEGRSLNLDSEDVSVKEIMVNDLKITIYQKEVFGKSDEIQTTLFWTDGRYFFSISATVELDELIKIAVGLQK